MSERGTAGRRLVVSFFGNGNGGAEPEQWRDMVLTNVYGAAITARATLLLLAETEGHLLLTGSVTGRHISDEQRAKPNLVPDDIARAVLDALEQPPSVDVNEIVVRPTGQVL